MTEIKTQDAIEAKIALTEPFIEPKLREDEVLVVEPGAVRLQRKYSMIPSIKKRESGEALNAGS